MLPCDKSYMVLLQKLHAPPTKVTQKKNQLRRTKKKIARQGARPIRAHLTRPFRRLEKLPPGFRVRMFMTNLSRLSEITPILCACASVGTPGAFVVSSRRILPGQRSGISPAFHRTGTGTAMSLPAWMPSAPMALRKDSSMADPAFVFKPVTALAAAFPHGKITRETIEVYVHSLSDLDEPLLNAAIMECLSTCEFFPTIKAIRDTAARLALGDHLEALEAWALVKRFARDGDYNYIHEFDDPLITECARILGWRDYLNSNTNDEPSWRARFCEIYNQLRERQVREIRSLPGVNEYRRLTTGTQSIGDSMAGFVKRITCHDGQ